MLSTPNQATVSSIVTQNDYNYGSSRSGLPNTWKLGLLIREVEVGTTQYPNARLVKIKGVEAGTA